MATRIVSLSARVRETIAVIILFMFYVKSWCVFLVLIKNMAFRNYELHMERNKPFRNGKEEICKLRNMWIFRFVIAMSGYVSYSWVTFVKRLAYYLSKLRRRFWRENALGHIMPVYGLLGFMPLLSIYIYIRPFLNLRTNSRDFMNIYIIYKMILSSSVILRMGIIPWGSRS